MSQYPGIISSFLVSTVSNDCAQMLNVMRCKVDSCQLEKYLQYTDELERVTRLLLLLAARLARLNNSQLTPSGEFPLNTPVNSAFLRTCILSISQRQVWYTYIETEKVFKSVRTQDNS